MNARKQITTRKQNVVHQVKEHSISVSIVLMYLYCPITVYLRYIKRYIPHVTFKQMLGRIIHAAAMAFYAAEKQLLSTIKPHSPIETIAQQGFKVIIKAALRATKNQRVTPSGHPTKSLTRKPSQVKIDQTTMAKQGAALLHYFIHRWAERVKHFSNVLGVTGATLADYLVPAPRQIEFSLGNSRGPITGARVDVLEGLTSLEIKTNRPPPSGVWPSDAVQVTLYALLLEQNMNTAIDSAKVNYIVFDELRHVKLTPERRGYALQLIDDVNTLFTNMLNNARNSKHNMPPRTHTNPIKCSACSYRIICPASLPS